MSSSRIAAASPAPRSSNRNKNVCSYCRQRKVGCDGKLPRCSFCIKNKVECHYSFARSKPGLRAGYVSKLEGRIDQLEARILRLEQPQASDMQTCTPSTESAPAYAPVMAHSEPPDEDASNNIQQTPDHFVMSDVHDWVHSAAPTLTPALAIELCGIWFEKYHPWFPILHQPSLFETLQSSPTIDSCSHSLTIKAIVAATMTQSSSLVATPAELELQSKRLGDQVLVEAVTQSSLQSIQALLILSNLDSGVGNLSKFWNLIALCKRMSLQLGLRDFLANQGNDYSNRSSIPPRLRPLPCTIVDREERIRAYWMTELLDSVSTLGGSWNPTSSSPDITTVLPCSDSIWAFPEHIINIWSIGDFYFSSAFSLCIILATSELWHVHRLLQQPLDLRNPEQKSRFQAESQQVDERLTTWRAEFVAAVYRLINTEHAQEERAEMDPNIVLTNCILDSAVITLFQKLSPCPTGIDPTCDPWTYATNRCVYAADDLSAKVRLVRDAELDAMSNPHLASTLFVAARFYLVYARAVSAEPPRNLAVLIHALEVCGRRWLVAKRYATLVQTAKMEHQMPIFMSSLPAQFFDLQFSVLDIHDALVLVADGIDAGLEMGIGIGGGCDIVEGTV